GAQQRDRLIADADRQVAVQGALDVVFVAVEIARTPQQRALALRVAREARAQEIAEQAVVGQPAGAAGDEQAMTLDLVEEQRRVVAAAQRVAALRREIRQYAGLFEEALQLDREWRDDLL